MNPNPVQSQKFFLDPSEMTLTGLNPAVPPHLPPDDPSKKVRKPYKITKCRESWTEQEHDKFLDAVQLFDRDWKKIEAFVGSKTVIQIRSHAQKYFLKVQKSGSKERVPPPRPKRKATHAYPQKAAKLAPTTSQSQCLVRYQNSPAVCEPGYIYSLELSSAVTNQSKNALMLKWNSSAVPPAVLSYEDVKFASRAMMPTVCCSESVPNAWHGSGVSGGRKPVHLTNVMPDFAKVYSFLGSVFDPDASGHLQRLKIMDPINAKTVLLLMKKLSINLTSPEFEDYRKLLSSYDVKSGRIRSCNPVMHAPGNSKRIIPAV